jgi:hypothetical protein
MRLLRGTRFRTCAAYIFPIFKLRHITKNMTRHSFFFLIIRVFFKCVVETLTLLFNLHVYPSPLISLYLSFVFYDSPTSSFSPIM